ncbi:MAG TPA: gliding motility-associated C-terminal domain-containing protein [Paludibacter sp.]|nr:gliding motility-associated C-terminal domain-containing protein [Paludibacter sp.]
MRRIFLLICLVFNIAVAFSRLEIAGTHIQIDKKDIEGTTKVIIFDTITSDTRIFYSGTNVRFYKFENINTDTYSTELFPPEDATGYVVEVDGVRTDTIWTISYKNYLPVFTALSAEYKPTEQCQEVNLLLDSNIPALSYRNINGTTFTFPREFKIAYKTLDWKGTAWSTINADVAFTAPQAVITVPAPLQATTFTVSGDQYAEELKIRPVAFTGPEYTPVAVACHLTTRVTDRTRSENNEDMAPSLQQPINFSAPIDVEFLSNANEPVTQYYKWEILKDNALLISRTDKDHRYTFNNAGEYKVKLMVSNSYCTAYDSISVTVTESAIQVPNVFTPNGDGMNDEFRIAYKSILRFECWVYNRWGRLVYHWTNPAKGWDGRIGGTDAAAGAYFYVIKATGSDSDPKNPGKRKLYKLQGDINLLR